MCGSQIDEVREEVEYYVENNQVFIPESCVCRMAGWIVR